MLPAHHVFLATAATAALAFPAGAAAQQDLRSPDARDAARETLGQPAQDLRSPDARDAASDLAPAPVESSVTIVRTQGDGFDWGDAGIGAGGILAVLLLGTGGFML